MLSGRMWCRCLNRSWLITDVMCSVWKLKDAPYSTLSHTGAQVFLPEQPISKKAERIVLTSLKKLCIKGKSFLLPERVEVRVNFSSPWKVLSLPAWQGSRASVGRVNHRAWRRRGLCRIVEAQQTMCVGHLEAKSSTCLWALMKAWSWEAKTRGCSMDSWPHIIIPLGSFRELLKQRTWRAEGSIRQECDFSEWIGEGSFIHPGKSGVRIYWLYNK